MITGRMREIYKLYQSGLSIEAIARRYDLTQGSVLKKIKKVEMAHSFKPKINSLTLNNSLILPQNKNQIWNKDNIKLGIDRFIAEKGVMPTSRDFDEVDYLPSARQIQRAHGGIVSLRGELGYSETDFTKGDLRKTIAIRSNQRGITAEEYIEPLLIEKFGEPFVHTQKRYYKGSKNRYDFLIYARDLVFGVDIFTTDRVSYIEKNIRHKISRYKNAPSELQIFFVLVGAKFTQNDLTKAAGSISDLANYPNMKALHESDFLLLISSYQPLDMPPHFLGLEVLESD